MTNDKLKQKSACFHRLFCETNLVSGLIKGLIEFS